jgi:hypothetical protein
VPGATPYQAVEAFLAPIERALAFLGTGKVVGSPRGRTDTSKTHSWSLNAGEGIVLRGRAAGSRFLAAMHYRIIPTNPEKYDVEQGRWRVTTSAYLYELRTPDNAKLWAMHWHPAGKSHATFSTCTPSAPTGTSSRRDRPSSRRCSGASRWGRSRRIPSGAPCWPSPKASTSSTDRGRRTRHRH